MIKLSERKRALFSLPKWYGSKFIMINSSNQTTGILSQLNIPLLVSIYICSSIGMIFNTAVCVIMWNGKCLYQSLNLLIANLALADIGNSLASIYSITVVSLALYNPQIFIDLHSIYLNNICKSVHFWGALSTCNSMTTLAMISIERFRGILYPLKLQFGQRQIKFMIAFSWIYSMILAALLTLFSSNQDHEVIECSAMLASQIKVIDTILIFSFGIMCYFVPLIVIVVCYISIAIRICRKIPPIDDSEYKKKVIKSISKRNRCIISLLTITIISSFSFFPFIAILNWVMYNRLTDPQFYWKQSYSTWEFFRFSSIISSLPTVINPILYNFANSQLKREIKQSIIKLKPNFCSIIKIRNNGTKATF